MNVRSLILVVASLTCFAASAVGQARSVTLEWDTSPDSSVAGYVVYVGEVSGSYSEEYRIGKQTSFVYTKAVPGRPYYFAVAAYSSDLDIGPHSEEVFFLSGAVTSVSAESAGPQREVAAEQMAIGSPPAADRVLCTGGAECYRVEPLASIPGIASSLTGLGDGRLLFIEDRTRVRAIDDDTLLPEVALNVETSGQLAGLVLDPDFARTRFAYLGVIQTHVDGSRELSIVRYREVANVLGEGAALVAGLPLPAVGDAYLAIDSARRFYVAMPAAPVSDPRASRYAGMVLRFENDGMAVRDDGPGAPVFSAGYAQPTSLAWTGSGNELWLTGTGAGWAGTLARLSLDRSSASALTVPEGVGLAISSSVVDLSSAEALASPARTTGDRAALILVDEAGGVFQVTAAQGGMAATAWIGPNALGGRVVTAIRGPGPRNADDFHVAVVTGDEPSTTASQIIRLRRN
jgi:hypothetical protein